MDHHDRPSRPKDAAARHGLSQRPAAEDDIAEILRIERAVHAAPWTEDNLKAEFAKPYAKLVVTTDDETDEKVAAYIAYWLMFDECHILNVAVDPGFRRLGLAKQLVMTVVRDAMRKNIRKILLDVRKGNAPAIALYQALGFVITHVRKDFYSDGEDAYQMARYIQEGEGEIGEDSAIHDF
jgi:ribosomal-protein-alanine N-acetyltransferase